MVVAPGRMIDSFLFIPDAESLPLYRMVLKLACVCVCGPSGWPGPRAAMGSQQRSNPRSWIFAKSWIFARGGHGCLDLCQARGVSAQGLRPTCSQRLCLAGRSQRSGRRAAQSAGGERGWLPC